MMRWCECDALRVCISLPAMVSGSRGPSALVRGSLRMESV